MGQESKHIFSIFKTFFEQVRNDTFRIKTVYWTSGKNVPWNIEGTNG